MNKIQILRLNIGKATFGEVAFRAFKSGKGFLSADLGRFF
jgi:hypothetical protein